MRSHILVMTLLCTSIACDKSVAFQRPVSIQPGTSPFVLPSGAENARVIQQGEGGVQYDLREKYSADGALADIQKGLLASGWTPLAQDLWNPGSPSSNSVGWRNYVDGTRTPKVRVYQWLGYWRNKGGDVVMHGISYTTPDISLGATPVGDGTGTIEIFTAEALKRAGIKVPN